MRRALSVEPFLLFAVLGVFLPWAGGADGSVSGIESDNGVFVLVLAAGAFLLRWAGVRWAWIAAGLGTVVTGRSLLRVLDVTGLTPGVGLWMTLVGLAAATVWLFTEQLGRVRAARSGLPGSRN